jgi:membrane-associated phospholipid phosphatase
MLTSKRPKTIPALVSVVGASTRFTVSLSFLLYTLYHRNPQSITFLILAIATAVLGKILKRLLSEARPSNSPLQEEGDHGMPSSHATSLSFISFTFVQITAPPAAAVGALAAYCAIALHYRHLRGLHTISQLFAGFLLGTTSSLVSYRYSPLASGVESRVSSWFASMGFEDSVPPHFVLGVAAVGGVVICAREIKQALRFTKQASSYRVGSIRRAKKK